MQGFKILTAICALVSLVAANDGRVTVTKPEMKNICLEKEDGVFLPITGSCSKYIICYNGSPVEKDCGKFHFSAKYLVCDLPERVGCASSQSLPNQTASKPVSENIIVIPKPTLPPCYAVANGISLPVPGNQRQYYYCMNNKAFLKDCGNMYFVAKYSACAVKPDNSDSSIIVIPPKAPSSQHEAESSVCLGKPDGASIAVAGNPRQYHYCMNNKAFLKDCGSKMVFASQYSACTLASIKTEEYIYPVEELEQTNTFKEATRKICANKNFGARLSLPGYCSLYVICTFNTGYVKTCGWREFNSATASCDLPENVRCQTYNQQTTEKLPEIKPTSKPSISTLANHICLNQYDGAFISAPGNCSEFFFCLKKIGYRKTCGNNRHFNPKTMICVDSKYSKCVDTSIKRSERAIIPRDESSCINKENGTLFSSSTSCGKFRICDNGIAKEMDCPAGLYFNPEENICDWPTNVQCAL